MTPLLLSLGLDVLDDADPYEHSWGYHDIGGNHIAHVDRRTIAVDNASFLVLADAMFEGEAFDIRARAIRRGRAGEWFTATNVRQPAPELAREEANLLRLLVNPAASGHDERRLRYAFVRSYVAVWLFGWWRKTRFPLVAAHRQRLRALAIEYRADGPLYLPLAERHNEQPDQAQAPEYSEEPDALASGRARDRSD